MHRGGGFYNEYDSALFPRSNKNLPQVHHNNNEKNKTQNPPDPTYLPTPDHGALQKRLNQPRLVSKTLAEPLPTELILRLLPLAAIFFERNQLASRRARSTGDISREEKRVRDAAGSIDGNALRGAFVRRRRDGGGELAVGRAAEEEVLEQAFAREAVGEFVGYEVDRESCWARLLLGGGCVGGEQG